MLHNLEYVESLEGCQWACENIQECSYFVYDKPMNVCTLSYDTFQNRRCDIVHGPKEPLFEQCIDNQELIWHAPENNGSELVITYVMVLILLDNNIMA